MIRSKIELYDALRKKICPFDSIIEEFPPEGEVLDVGCGYGTFCIMLSEKRPKIKITGIELDKDRVIKAKNRIKSLDIELLNADATNFEIGKNFDIIICLDLIHHIPYENHACLLNNLNKQLKRGGLLIVKDMDNRPFIKYLWNNLQDIVMTKSTVFSYMSKDKMVTLLQDGGFKVESVKDISNLLYAHFLITCRKI
jgi:2-polyprenyl-3-methyl-5-hydroxy-6-metoxy-1,4-benzoquinol methylase